MTQLAFGSEALSSLTDATSTDGSSATSAQPPKPPALPNIFSRRFGSAKSEAEAAKKAAQQQQPQQQPQDLNKSEDLFIANLWASEASDSNSGSGDPSSSSSSSVAAGSSSTSLEVVNAILLFLEKLYSAAALDAAAALEAKNSLSAEHTAALLLLARHQSPSATTVAANNNNNTTTAEPISRLANTHTLTACIRAVFHSLIVSDVLQDAHEMELLAQLGLDDDSWPLFVPREHLVPLSRLAVKRLRRYGAEDALLVSLWEGFLHSLHGAIAAPGAAATAAAAANVEHLQLLLFLFDMFSPAVKSRLLAQCAKLLSVTPPAAASGAAPAASQWALSLAVAVCGYMVHHFDHLYDPNYRHVVANLFSRSPAAASCSYFAPANGISTGPLCLFRLEQLDGSASSSSSSSSSSSRNALAIVHSALGGESAFAQVAFSLLTRFEAVPYAAAAGGDVAVGTCRAHVRLVS